MLFVAVGNLSCLYNGNYLNLIKIWKLFRACSVSTQSIWIECDWISLNLKQVKLVLNFFQSHSIYVYWE